MTTGEERKDFHELYGDDPFDDERHAAANEIIASRQHRKNCLNLG
jgi:hypothetical protein